MRNRFANTLDNVVRFSQTLTALEKRSSGIPGMGLVEGYTGAGKTTTVVRELNQRNGIYVRANSVWTPSAMYRALLHELGISPLNSAAKMLDAAVGSLLESGRPVFVDEADYLLKGGMLESLRDLHDLTGVPVVLIGMEGLSRKIKHRPQLTRRISQWVEFQRASMDDARILADTCCEVEVGDDLLLLLHQQAKGSVGQMIVGLSRIEAYAQAQPQGGWTKISLKQWKRNDAELLLQQSA